MEINNDLLMEWFLRSTPDNDLASRGYTRLSDCPEVRMGLERIADLVSNMTIHLMQNTKDGDVRVQNGLSRKIDINPCKNMTRQSWVAWIVKSLILNGNTIVYPTFEDGRIEDLIPIPWSNVSIIDKTMSDYEIRINGQKFKYEDLLHFRINPMEERPWIGESYKITLKDVTDNLKQAGHTTKEFMSNKIIPNIIVKVDALTEELADGDGRAKVYDKFVTASKAGQPWIVPAGLIDVEQVKPLTLNDIAITDTVKMDKKTVAGILGVPAFLLGVGEFNEDEYNNFIRTRIMTLAKAIEQELTRKLLLASDLYFKFNSRSLYAYSLVEQTNIYHKLYTSGIVTGNEVRDMLGLSPREELNDLIVLENFIPVDRIGDQDKLKGGEEDE